MPFFFRIQKVKENLNRLPDFLEKYHASQAKKAEAAKALDEKKRQLLEDVSYPLFYICNIFINI